jgi:hypothetical protein
MMLAMSIARFVCVGVILVIPIVSLTFAKAQERSGVAAPLLELEVGGGPASVLTLPKEALERHAHRAEVIGDTLYVFGGFARGKAGEPDRGGRAVFAIDLRDGKSKECASLPVAMQAGSSCVVDGVLHAIGGGIVARYDAKADTWTTLTEPDVLPASHFSATVFDGAIVVVGGFPFRDSCLLQVDLETFAVTPMEAPPDFRKGDHFVFCAVLGGRLHLLGGINEADLLDRHWILENGAWREGAKLPVPALAKFAAHGIVDGAFVVFDSRSLAHRYDAAKDEWVAVANWPELRVMPACFVVGDRLHVIGGLYPREVDEYDASVYDAKRDQWLEGD